MYLVLLASLLSCARGLLRDARGTPEAVASCGLLLVTIVLGLTSSEGLHGPVGFTFWSLTALLPELRRGQGLTGITTEGTDTVIKPRARVASRVAGVTT
jgi:hypothetical protein